MHLKAGDVVWSSCHSDWVPIPGPFTAAINLVTVYVT